MKRIILIIGLIVPASSYSMNANNDLTPQEYYWVYQQQKENTPLSTSPHYIVAPGYPRKYSQWNSVLGKTEEFVAIYAIKPQLFLDETFFHLIVHTQETDHFHSKEKINKPCINSFGITNLAGLLGIILLTRMNKI